MKVRGIGTVIRRVPCVREAQNRARLALIALPLLAACNQNPQVVTAVQKMVQVTDAAAPSYAALAADYSASCHRQSEWTVTGNLPTPSPSAPTTGTTSDSCAGSQLVSTQWQNMNVIVISYIDALGKLADNGQTSSSYGFNSVADGLTTSKILTQTQASAITQLFSAVTKDIFNNQRTDAIVEYAPEARDALDNIITRLESVADDDYRVQLSLERLDINDFYKRGMLAEKTGRMQSEVFQRREWNADLNDLDDRVAAIDKYKASLEALRTAHDALVQEANKQNPDIQNIVDTYAAQFLPQIDSISRAFSKTGAPARPR